MLYFSISPVCVFPFAPKLVLLCTKSRGEKTWVCFWSLTNSEVMFLTLQLHPTVSELQGSMGRGERRGALGGLPGERTVFLKGFHCSTVM